MKFREVRAGELKVGHKVLSCGPQVVARIEETFFDKREMLMTFVSGLAGVWDKSDFVTLIVTE